MDTFVKRNELLECHLSTMETTLKVKRKSKIVPQNQFPSERRYSASMVRGLSVIFLVLFMFSLIMGFLIVYKMTVHIYTNTTNDQNNEENLINNEIETTTVTLTTQLNPVFNNMTIEMLKLYQKVNEDMSNIIIQNSQINKHIDSLLHQNKESNINIPVAICSGCFLMSIGHFMAFATGLLAWKLWYIDHYITLFFFASLFSILTSSMGLVLSIITCRELNYDYDTYIYAVSRNSPLTFGLIMNVTICSVAGLILSILSSKEAFCGMRSSYPDDFIINKTNAPLQKYPVLPKGIVDNYSTVEKLAKYIPQEDNSNLPKPESTLEYQQRFDRFLSEVP